MNKIKLLILALLCCVGSSAWGQGTKATGINDLKEGKVYTLSTKRGSVVWNGEGEKLIGSTSLDDSNPNHQFALFKHLNCSNKFFIVNVGSGKLLYESGNDAKLSETKGDVWTVKESGNDDYPLMIDAMSGEHWNFGGGGQITIDTWGTKDDGNRFSFVEVGDVPSEINTFFNNLINNGLEVLSTPQFGGRVWTWNTGTNVFDSEGKESTATPGRDSNKGAVLSFTDAGTTSANAGADTSDGGGIKVYGESNVTSNLKNWAGSIEIGTGSIGNISYGNQLKGTEPDTRATVWTDGNLTFNSSRTNLSIDDGGNQYWFIGENGSITSSFTSVSRGSHLWNIQIIVADEPAIDGKTRKEITDSRRVLSWGSNISSNINSITVFKKNGETYTKLSGENLVAYDNTGITINYTRTINVVEKQYTVSIVGAPDGTKITVGGTEYGNGESFNHEVLQVSDITVPTISKYQSSITIGENTITVTYTLDMTQFNQISDLKTLSNSKAYYIIAHDNSRGAWTYNSSDQGWLNSTIKAGTTASILNTDQHFAFLKSEKGNYYLYSIAAAKFVAYSAEDGGRAALVDNPTNTITFKASTGDFVSSPWVVSFVDGNHDIGISNNYSHGVITYWNSTSDGGNCVKIYDTEVAFDATAALQKIEAHEAVADFTQMNVALAKAQARLPLLGVGYGKYSEVTSGALQTAITTAQAFNQETTPASKQTDVDNATTALLNSASINVPQSDSYIRIKGSSTGRYLLAGTANGKFKTGEIPSDTPDDAIFYVTESGKLQNVGSGKFNGMHKSSWSWVDTEESASSVTFSEGQGVVGKYQILSKDAYFYDADSNADRGGVNNGNARYNSWILEEVKSLDITVTAAGWATACIPFQSKIISGNATAKYVTVDGTTLTKTDATIIPAEEGVLIKYTGDELTSPATATVTFLQSTATADEATDNMMKGTVAEGGTTFDKSNTKYYILAKDPTGGLGFYYQKGSPSGASATCAQYKAVLAVPNGTEVKGFRLEDDEFTAIEGIDDAVRSEEPVVRSYNLSGQAVGSDYKGIVIKNGKKYLNK